jgi:hypothetical protein
MATNLSVLKASDNEAAFKFSGAGTTTIALSGPEILHSNQVTAGATQTVDITGFAFTGALDAVITISRNSIVIATCPAASSNFIDLGGQLLIPDSTQHTKDIVVTITGQGELWLRVRKMGGYQTKVEEAIYGSYDDITRIGASTTVTGSPDKV